MRLLPTITEEELRLLGTCQWGCRFPFDALSMSKVPYLFGGTHFAETTLHRWLLSCSTEAKVLSSLGMETGTEMYQNASERPSIRWGIVSK